MPAKPATRAVAPARRKRIVLEEGVLRVGTLTGLPDVLRELGADPAQVTAAADVDVALFGDPENTISFVALGRLLGLCAERTRCPHFGLLVGQRGGPTSLGIVGYLMQHSPDVGSALRNLILHLHLHDRGAVPTLCVRDGIVSLGYAIYLRGVTSASQIYDGAIAIGFNIMRSLCGPDWLPMEVHFSHSKPDDLTPYRRFFKAPLRFGAEQTTLMFRARWLTRPLPGADATLRGILQRRVEALEANGGVDIVAQLRRVLRSLLLTGSGSLDQVAQLFSMHRRTLNRRLEASGATFQRLVEETRYEIARQLLDDTRMSVVEIAGALDYADASAFTRAFKRWSGSSPAAWRATHSHG